MYSESKRKIPLKQAIGYVLLSVLVIWGSLLITWLIHRLVVEKRQAESRYTINVVVQTCPQKEALETWQLVELLQLSRDKPQNLYAFDPVQAVHALRACPVIKKAAVRRLPPSILHVDYSVREPYVQLADFSNTAVDSEGSCFPIRPYFTPKKLPEFYLGLNELSYSAPLDSKEARLAFTVFDYAKKALPKAARVVRVDTHKAYSVSAGLEEVVVALEDGGKTRYLRLNPRSYQSALSHYELLRPTLDQVNPAVPVQIVDLRSPNLALVK